MIVMQLYGTETIKGKDFKITIDGEGRFCATVNGEDIYRDTLRKLRVDIAHILAKKPLNIPFVEANASWEDFIVRKGVITGIHGRTGDYLLKYDNGSTGQSSKYGSSLLRADTNIKRLKALDAAKEKALAEFDKFIADNKLEVKSEIEES
jgi:hypothetical protein